MKTKEFAKNRNINEAPLSDRAMSVLNQVKMALNQPGEQVPTIKLPIPTKMVPKDYATLNAEIRRLEKILAIANSIEKVAERIGRTHTGMDPGIQTELDIVRAWPVPKTDKEMTEMLAKFQSTLEKFKKFQAYKRKVWNR